MAATMMLSAKPGLTSTFHTGRSVATRVAVPRAVRSVTVRASADRPKWYPGATPPAYLGGSLAGDYGFDSLRLGSNPDSLPWLVEAEKTNGRWAMAAVAGILFTDILGLPKWWNAGAETELPIPLNTLLIIEVVVMGLLEAKRYEGWKKTGMSGALNSYPFDPLGFNSAENQVKEIKNGRLAMLAFLGFVSVYAVRGLSPIDALNQHIASPATENIYTSSVGNEFAIAVVAASIAPVAIETKKALGGDDDDEFDPIPW